MRISKKKIQPQFCLRLKLGIGNDAIGPGKVKLLLAIDKHGSISAAARDLSINYRRAWFLLETMNTALGQPVAVTTKGGRDGGGANLTNVGRAVLKAYYDCVMTTNKTTQTILSDLQLTLANAFKD